jgi:signal transduction histidine kinase
MIEKVLYNLVDNSIRHGDGVTMLSLSHRLEGDALVIEYTDDGVGVPPADKERIFERGFGSNTGLGLFLTREILAITNIEIRETGVKGVRFEIRVPQGRYRIDS